MRICEPENYIPPEIGERTNVTVRGNAVLETWGGGIDRLTPDVLFVCIKFSYASESERRHSNDRSQSWIGLSRPLVSADRDDVEI